MNLSARINSKQKQNYILNVNINIPIRPSNLQSHRPLSGEFAFSPSQRSKRLKLQIPSARTTNQCESRKISYLGETQNTITHRNNNNRKRTVKSAFPSQQISQLFNTSKKSKSQYRSQALAVSPNRKRTVPKTAKKQKQDNKNLFISKLINQSQDNIVGYTSQSSQLANKIISSNFQERQKEGQNTKNLRTSFKFKSQSPLLEEQKQIIYDIRQFQKNAMEKKEHLNYQYLKQKILILASVKKIQRAWRNYKTKKLIKSYSNNISLKFTGKLKNQLNYSKQPEENKILTVRSCGYSGNANQFKKKGKKNLSQLFEKDGNIQIQQQFDEFQLKSQQNRQNLQKKNLKKYKNLKESSKKSAIVQFQIEQIERWQELIHNIRQGKKVDEVLQKSFKRKQQLQKQLYKNLKDMSQSSNSSYSHHQKLEQKQQIEAKAPLVQNLDKPDAVAIKSQVSVSSESSIKQSPNTLKKQQTIQFIQTGKMLYEQEEGETTKRRRKKLQYFQNELRKIDNQSESNFSHSYISESEVQSPSPQVKINQYVNKADDQDSFELKKKLQAINRIQMFNQESVQSKESQQERQGEHYLYSCLTQQKTIAFDIARKNEYQTANLYDIVPLSINTKNIQISGSGGMNQLEDTDRLDTFRKKMQDHKNSFYQSLEEQRLKKMKRKKLSAQQKEQLTSRVYEQLLYDVLLQFSQNDLFIKKMESLHNAGVIKAEQEKPQGICTNLESIKDYLQNLVAYAFQQQPILLTHGFNQPKQPTVINLLNFLNQQQARSNFDSRVPVLSLRLFNQHWQYASQQIYFDPKYTNQPVKEQQRVKHLKAITKIYFRAIFDGFNQCLQNFRLYGTDGQPFPWDLNTKSKITNLSLTEIKPLIRLGYRKLSQIAVIYCGLLFEDKKHNMSQKMIEEIQKERLDTLVELEMEEMEFQWHETSTFFAQVLFKLSKKIYQTLVLQACQEWSQFGYLGILKQK